MTHRPTPPTPRPPLAVTCLAVTLALASACGDKRDEGQVLAEGGWNLLGRSADFLWEQPGRLTPSQAGSEGEPWGRLGRMGWEKELRHAAGTTAVRATGSSAFLTLPSAVARSRTIELEAWVTAGDNTQTDPHLTPLAEVALNDVVLGRVELSSDPSRVLLAAPAEVWVEGDNLLRIAFVPMAGAQRSAPDPTTLRLNLARVDYDTVRSIAHSRARGKATLETDTALGFLFEPLGPGHLLVGARARGRGDLRIEVHAVDRRTGDLGDELQTLQIALDSQSVERGIVLPSEAGQLLRVLVGWRSEQDEDSSLELTELKVSETEATPRPPVILISIDTLAAENSGVWGYGRDTTPALAALAEDGITFERCLSNATWTLPSFLSLMTGLFPGAHRGDPSALGRDRHVDLWEQWYLTDNRLTLAEALRARGYRTAGWVDTVWLRERFNFPQGFEHFDSEASLIEKPNPDGGLRFVTDGALDWLEGIRPEEPYFLFLHAFDVHGPYAPDRAHRGLWRDRLDLSRMAPAGGVHNAFGAIPDYITEAEWPEGVPGQVPVARVRAAYDEGLSMTDGILGEFLGELRARGLYDQALIIVTSDHGETMGQGPYRFGHGVLQEAVLHIPLVVKLPGNRLAGTHRGEALSLVDLYPSILSIAGGTSPASLIGLHGSNRFGEQASLDPGAPVFSETGLCRQYSIEADDWRLVELWPGQESTPEFLLTHPLAGELVQPTEEGQLLESFVPSEELSRLRADRTLVAWIRAAVRDGLTPGDLNELREDEEFEPRIQLLRRTLRGPFHLLGRTGKGSEPSLSLASQHPAQVARLKRLLAAAVARRDEARALGHAPTQAVELSADQLEELSNIGYAER